MEIDCINLILMSKKLYKIKYYINVDVFGTIGLTRWDQSETTLTAGTSSSFVDHSGIDGIYGIGVTAQKNALSFSLEYQDYDMYYDAKSIGASISYKF